MERGVEWAPCVRSQTRTATASARLRHTAGSSQARRAGLGGGSSTQRTSNGDETDGTTRLVHDVHAVTARGLHCTYRQRHGACGTPIRTSWQCACAHVGGGEDFDGGVERVRGEHGDRRARNGFLLARAIPLRDEPQCRGVQCFLGSRGVKASQGPNVRETDIRLRQTRRCEQMHALDRRGHG